MSTLIAAPKLDSERGFLPLRDPLARLPQPFDEWESVALGLPKLFDSDHLRRTIEELPPFLWKAISNDRERERAMALLSYLGHAYVWGEDKPAQILPKRLAVTWHSVPETLGGPPVLSYSSYALPTFSPFDPDLDV